MAYSKLGGAVKRIGRFFGSRIVMTALLALFIGFYAYYLTDMIHTVYIVDGEATQVALTTESDYERLLDDRAISTTPFDSILRRDGNGFAMLSIRRGFSVTLTVDGVQHTHTVTESPCTVGDLLEQLHLTVDEDDYCSLPMNHELLDGESITLIHATAQEVEEFESIPYEVEYKSTSLIRSGRERTITDGSNGRRRCVYRELYDDRSGELISREQVLAETLEPAVNQLTLVGDGSAVSRLDWSDEYPIGSNGIPEDYLTVYRGEKATGYYFEEGCWGSSGGYCYAGTAAVQLAMFPYGTKLYVRASDPNSEFVYGYTIANDTGGLEYVGITLDLFYETYAESALNGLKNVDIYVLEWGNGTVN